MEKIRLLVFILLSIPIVLLSRHSLLHLRAHGFYRFAAWECILWLAISNIRYWFDKPFSLPQVISWICLFYCLYLVLAGAITMKKTGKADEKRVGDLYTFEKTTCLIESGIFRYVRHPLYGSLLFLTWGIYLKHPDLFLMRIALLSTIFLILTSLVEEQENIAYFGDIYKDYRKRTKMFLPFLI
jgi:protein-S-isoprenylcysteine O-methyltransferase Ste14